MKALGNLILTLTIFGSTLAFADHRIQKTCLTIPAQNNQNETYISAEAVIDEETGLTKAFLVSTTYEGALDCLDSLDKKFEAPEMPTNPQERLRSRSACYTNTEEENAVFLVDEKVNPETGLVVALEIKNEFDSLNSCLENL